jgi:hypothetical protein
MTLCTEDLPRSEARRKADWNKHCVNDCPLSLCSCIDICECGHLRSQHAFDYAEDTGPDYGCCDVQMHEDGRTCPCSKFEHAEEDQ